MKKIVIILISIFTLTSCGTIVNDPNVPVSLSFSDGSDGECKLNNKRASYSVNIPSTTMVRRSDDALDLIVCQIMGKKVMEAYQVEWKVEKLLPVYSFLI